MKSQHHNGVRGVYLVAAEVSRLGYGVAPTARNAPGADLLVYAANSAQARSIDVKTNAGRRSYWLMGKSARHTTSPTHFYVFLNISSTEGGGEVFEYYVVPSRVVARGTVVERGSAHAWYSFELKKAKPYRDRWSLLGSA
jgi:hypothetical protein